MEEQQRRSRGSPLERADRALERGRRVVAGEPREHVAPQVRPALELARAGRRSGLEPLPDAVDGGKPLAQVGRQQQMLHDDLQVGLERSQPIHRPRPDVAAEARRADSRDRLDDRQLVAALEEREQAARMVPRGRQRVRPRPFPGDLRGDRRRGGVIDRRGIAIPGGLPREPSEVREQLGVDAPVGVGERGLGQLVEHDVDDRHRGARRSCNSAPGRAGEQQAADGRDDEEQEQHDQRRGGEHRHERAHAGRARVQGGGAGADEERERHGEGGSPQDVSGRRQHEPRNDQRHQGQHDPPSELRPDPARAPDDARTDHRRKQDVAEGQHEDVARRAAARDEELGVAPEQVEQRLCERQRPQPAEMQRGAREADRAAHARGRAS